MSIYKKYLSIIMFLIFLSHGIAFPCQSRDARCDVLAVSSPLLDKEFRYDMAKGANVGALPDDSTGAKIKLKPVVGTKAMCSREQVEALERKIGEDLREEAGNTYVVVGRDSGVYADKMREVSKCIDPAFAEELKKIPVFLLNPDNRYYPYFLRAEIINGNAEYQASYINEGGIYLTKQAFMDLSPETVAGMIALCLKIQKHRNSPVGMVQRINKHIGRILEDIYNEHIKLRMFYDGVVIPIRLMWHGGQRRDISQVLAIVHGYLELYAESREELIPLYEEIVAINNDFIDLNNPVKCGIPPADDIVEYSKLLERLSSRIETLSQEVFAISARITQIKSLPRLNDACKDLRHLNSIMMKFYKKHYKKVDVTLGELIDKVLYTLNPEARLEAAKKIVIDEDFKGVLINCDPEMTAYALGQILLNARDLGIGRVSFKVKKFKDDTRLIIEDDGPGFPSHMLSEGIFPDRQNAFASDITAREGGTGLGLAFLWYVLKGQDMEIKVDSGSSLKKGGARFIIVYSKTETVIRYKQEKLSMTDSDWIKVGLILEGKTECKEGEENRYLRYKNCHDPLRQLVAMRKARGLKRGLTLPEETLLIAEYRKGNGAAYEILRRWHLPLIYREAHRFIGCYNLPEEKFDDLVSEGAIGFFKALKKYDPSRGVHIRTYAAYWVSQSMSRGIQKEHLGDIRLPIGVRTKLNKLYRAEMRFYNEFDRSPEPEDYDTIRIFAEEEGVSEELFRKLVRIRSERCDISIDDPISEDSRRRFRDSIPDIRVRMADDEVEIAENIELDRNIFERLRNIFIEKGKEKQFRIYCMYKGYDPDTGEKIDEDLSLDDVGAEYGLTRERVRQIVAKVEKRRKQIVLMVLSKKQPEDEEIAPPKAKAKKRPSKRVRRSV